MYFTKDIKILDMQKKSETTKNKKDFMKTSLYLIIFDKPPSNTSSIESDLKAFGASHVNQGDILASIKFRLPHNFSPNPRWLSFLDRSHCNLEYSSLPISLSHNPNL
jgi:hypothetical protein